MSIYKGTDFIAGVPDMTGYAQDSNVVHKSGDETIAGAKTFTNHITIKSTDGSEKDYFFRNDTLDLTDTSRSSNVQHYLRLWDKNNYVAGNLGFVCFDGGTTRAFIQARNRASGTQVSGSIEVNVDNQGNVYTSAPTPAVSNNSTQIATTAYVNTKFQQVSALPANPDADTFYFIPES